MRKTVQDLDLYPKSALKSNEKLIKDQLGIKLDYQKVAKVAGELQGNVHNLQEEVKEMKLKIDLDVKSKVKAEVEKEKWKNEIDSVGIPKCPICAKWFPNAEVIKRHIGSIHEGQRNVETDRQNTLTEMKTHTNLDMASLYIWGNMWERNQRHLSVLAVSKNQLKKTATSTILSTTIQLCTFAILVTTDSPVKVNWLSTVE